MHALRAIALWSAALGITLSLSALHARPCAGQAALLLHNYNRIPVGELGGLQGGARVARSGDADAGWYNPAGLARARRNSLSANASLFESITVTVDNEKPGESLNTIGNFVGSASRSKGEWLPEALVWGFSIVAPMHIATAATARYRDDYLIDGLPVPDVSTTFDAAERFTVLAPGLAAGLELGTGWRAGAGLRLYLVELGVQTGQLSRQSFAGDEPYFNLTESETAKGSATLLRLEAGMQADLARNLSAGITVRSPTATLSAQASVRLYSLLAYDNAGTETRITSISQADADDVAFDFRLPLEVDLGIAWSGGPWEVELDVFYHAAVGRYDFLGSFDVTTQEQDYFTIYEDSVLKSEPITNEAIAVLNVALGGSYKFSETLSLHGGVFTDRSPTRAGNQLFQPVDLTGVSVGASSFAENTSTSFGVSMVQGAARVPFTDPVTLESRLRRVSVRAVSLLLAGSVYF